MLSAYGSSPQRLSSRVRFLARILGMTPMRASPISTRPSSQADVRDAQPRGVITFSLSASLVHMSGDSGRRSLNGTATKRPTATDGLWEP